MEEKSERMLYRVNSTIGVLFQITVLWTIANNALKHEHHVTLLLVTLLSAAGACLTLPFNWSDKDRRLLTVTHIIIQALMISVLAYPLI
jgi:hypothetical protein